MSNRPSPLVITPCDGTGIEVIATPDGPDYAACPGCPACDPARVGPPPRRRTDITTSGLTLGQLRRLDAIDEEW